MIYGNSNDETEDVAVVVDRDDCRRSKRLSSLIEMNAAGQDVVDRDG